MHAVRSPEKGRVEQWETRKTNQITIGIVGSGGDGAIAAGEIMASAAAHEGLYCILTKSYGATIRGGESSARIRLGANRVHSQGDKLDVLVCFSWKDFKLFKGELELKDQCVILYPEGDEIQPDQLPIEPGLHPTVIRVPFIKLAKEDVGNELTKNIVMLGVLAELFDLPKKGLVAAIHHRFERKSKDLIDLNLKALNIGSEYAKNNIHETHPIHFFYTTSPPKLLMTGNEAIAIGALNAGCRFMAGYPITPATEIMESLTRLMPMYDGTVVQAEDEIAAAAMVIGASFAGVKAMTATSGPGVSLMQEMIGLAAIAEIPFVLVNVQRGGPATGIPTKSEQADLMQAIFGSHGDAFKVVLAPCDVQDCYDIIQYAFAIAENFQVPVIVLSDQFLGQRKASFTNLFPDHIEAVERKLPTESDLENYLRFKLSKTGVSPMTHPGIEGGEYLASGISHMENGYPTSSYVINEQQTRKRYQKSTRIIEKYPLWHYYGQKGATLGLLGWGSTKGVIREAVHLCTTAGIDAVGMVPRILHPLPIDELQDWFSTLSNLIVIEMSYSGQFLQYLRSQMKLPSTLVHYKRSGGSLIPLGEILNLIIEHCEESVTPEQKRIVDPEGIYDLDKPPTVSMHLRGGIYEL
jgi:2-oxoglutarate ferredoxin oxidoreductase subunit alpha